MTDEQLRDAYQQSLAERARPNRLGCPDLEALLAVVQRDGPETQRIVTLDHALTCPACRRELEVLRTVDQATRAATGERGERAGPRVGRVFAWRAVPLALAASLALALGLGVARQFWDRGAAEPVRAAPDGNGIALVTPEDGAAVSLPATLAWRPVPGARWYVAELVTEDGIVSFSARTTDTSLTAPSIQGVAPGEYRWTVRAQLGSGAVRRAAARRLRILAP